MAVVEGIGEHGCEYMTGGTVVVLGPTGKNFAAGMSGGQIFVLDLEDRLEAHLADESIHAYSMSAERDRQLVRRMLENHVSCTGSAAAARVLSHWRRHAGRFVVVVPMAYERMFSEARARGREIRPPDARADRRSPCYPAGELIMAERHPNEYIDTRRQEIGYRDGRERRKDYREIYAAEWSEPSVKSQARRCMDCGVPTCIGSCPIANHIPDWNDLVSRGECGVRPPARHQQFSRVHRICVSCTVRTRLRARVGRRSCDDQKHRARDCRQRLGSRVDRAATAGEAQRIPRGGGRQRTDRVGRGPTTQPRWTRCSTVFERDDVAGGLVTLWHSRLQARQAPSRQTRAAARAGGHRIHHATAGRTRYLACRSPGFCSMPFAWPARALNPQRLDLPGCELGGVEYAMTYLMQENRRQARRPVENPICARGGRVVVVGGGDTGADCVATANRQGASCVTRIDINTMRPLVRPRTTPGRSRH